MNNRVRTTLQILRSPLEHENVTKSSSEATKERKEEMHRCRSMNKEKVAIRRKSSREKKIALQQDVNKLKKKLRHEGNVHRALERAFTRPLGALPRLPPYLPPYTLELLAEVAVLEEEVIRLEEQLVNFRQGLYQEAVYISSSKKSIENVLDSCGPQSFYNFKKEKCKFLLEDMESALTSRGTIFDKKDLCFFHPLPSGRKQPEENVNEVCGKENRPKENSVKFNVSPVQQKNSQNHNSTMNLESKSSKEHSDSGKIQLECRLFEHDKAEINASDTSNDTMLVENDKDNPNEISENIMKCLKSIFLRMKIPKGKSGCLSSKGFKDVECSDPYEICSEFGKRDVGPYKHLRVIEMSSVDHNRITDSSSLMKKLRRLLGKLVSVDLHGLTHQQKLAFWINIYNSCMMNAFLENGIPKEPEMVLQLMKKASINVSGHVLNAMTIEHFILRLPHHSRHSHVNFKGLKNEELAARSIFGLDFREPLVTFALSCGSWSSPAVKIYTADQVENEMEAAKRDYLQAAIGISTANKLAIPKLLDWYLLDFAKDIESLLDWICLQLPDGLSKEALKCLEKVRKDSPLQSIQVIPYEFTFRYLLDP